ncbi:MAG: peptidoglycan DD-metalloendopeptidase family protein [Bacteroidales bacterium]|nr:peptidoglycan DD-metalloendopeptidase family protein [Bacteroidales bacterium]
MTYKFIWTVTLLCTMLILFPIDYLISQDKKSKLQKEKIKIEEEIKYTNKLLAQTKHNRKASLDEIVMIRNKISSRERLIQNITNEINIINSQIDLNNEIINDLSKDLESLRSEYAKMIYHTYKTRNSYDKLMFIFASTDFNQAYKRLKYFQQYSEYRKNQLNLIQKTQDEINTEIGELEESKSARLALLSDEEKERNSLKQEKKDHDSKIRDLNEKEKDYLALIEEKETAALQLQKEIQRIIAEEIRLAAKNKGGNTTGIFSLTPEEQVLSENFEANRGGLPWPLERGIISSNFGEHPHPVLKNVKVKNNGIDVLTEPQSKARAIFAGVVTRVMSIPNYNYVVMIRHGEFLSVYSNLDEVYVVKGADVEIKQELGRIFTSTNSRKTELHFELWQGKNLLNPVKWLARN